MVEAKFSEAQLAIYSIVLFVQNGIINLLKEKSVSLDELYGFMIISFSQKLFELGFFESAKKDEILRWTQILSPQFVGHHIGLDLHDTLEIPTSTKLRPGMVINSMPGLYIPKDDRFPKGTRRRFPRNKYFLMTLKNFVFKISEFLQFVASKDDNCEKLKCQK